MRLVSEPLSALTAAFAAPALSSSLFAPASAPAPTTDLTGRVAAHTVSAPAHDRGSRAQSGRVPGLSNACVKRGSSKGLQSWPAKVRTRVDAQFDVDSIGGYRSGSGHSDHHSGRALDVMVTGAEG